MTYGVAQAPAGRSWKWAYPVPQGEERYDIVWFGDEMHLAAEPSVSSAG